ncbi:MAG: hypothetical protein U0840_03615 [Gemmataceae bacterium]
MFALRLPLLSCLASCVAVSLLALAGPVEQPAPAPPSVFVDVSQGLLNAVAGGPRERPKPVRDCILGTSIRGSSYTRGQSSVELVPDENHMCVDIVLKGLTTTDTVGRNKPVCLYSDGTICFEVRQRAWIDTAGVKLGEPVAQARSDSTLRCLTTDYRGALDRLIKGVALRRYEKQKDEATFIADRHAEDEYEKDMSEDMRKEADRMQKDLNEYLDTLRKQGVARELLRVRTLQHVVQITAAYWPTSGPRREPPPLVRDVGDLTARAHEATLGHYLRSRLAGEKLTEENARERMASLLGLPAPKKTATPAPKNGNNNQKKGPEWTLTFDRNEPIRFRFDGGEMVAVVRIAEFTSDEDTYPAMDVTARYVFEQDRTGSKLRRKSPVEAYPAGFVPGQGKKLSARQMSVRSVVEKRLNQSVPETVPLEDITLTGELAKISPLRVTGLEPIGGWLLVTLRRLNGN